MIIKNGLVIDPASGFSEKMDLLIEDGIIKEMATQITKEGEDVLDATGFVIAPGLIDTHVHFRDPGFTYKETIHTGALASAKGGFTSVICMANTSPTVDSVPVLTDNLARASKEKIRIFQAASISKSLKGQEETNMDALKKPVPVVLPMTESRLRMLLSAIRQWKKLLHLMSRSVCMKKILLSSATMESAMERYPMPSASTALLQSLKNLWLQETACWHSDPVPML